MSTRVKVWVVVAVVSWAIFIVWPKPTVEPVPQVPQHETIFTSFAKGMNDAIGDFVREDLWKRTEEKRSAPRQD